MFRFVPLIRLLLAVFRPAVCRLKPPRRIGEGLWLPSSIWQVCNELLPRELQLLLSLSVNSYLHGALIFGIYNKFFCGYAFNPSDKKSGWV